MAQPVKKDSIETLEEVMVILDEREERAMAEAKEYESLIHRAIKLKDESLRKTVAERLVRAMGRLREVQDCRREIKLIKIYKQETQD